MATPTLAELLNQFMSRMDIGNQKLSKQVDELTRPHTSHFVPKSSINNWRTGASKSPQDPWQVVALALALELEVSEINQLLQVANLPSLIQLGQRADKPAWLADYATIFEPATEPVEPPVEQKLVGLPALTIPATSPPVINNYWLIGVALVSLLLGLPWLSVTQFQVWSQTNHWAIQLHEVDDRAIAFINGQLVAYVTEGHSSPWVNLQPYLNHDPRPDYLTVLHLNGPHSGKVDIRLRYGQQFSDTIRSRYLQQFDLKHHLWQLQPDGYLTPVTYTPHPDQPDRWQVHLIVDNFGVILVNGVPAWGVYGSDSGQFGWADISRFFQPHEAHQIQVQGWQIDGTYELVFNLCRNDQLMWSVTESGHDVPSPQDNPHLKIERSVIAETLSPLGDCPLE